MNSNELMGVMLSFLALTVVLSPFLAKFILKKMGENQDKQLIDPLIPNVLKNQHGFIFGQKKTNYKKSSPKNIF